MTLRNTREAFSGDCRLGAASVAGHVADRCGGALWEMRKTHAILKTQAVTVKGSLEHPGQHGDFFIVGNTELSTRARG